VRDWAEIRWRILILAFVGISIWTAYTQYPEKPIQLSEDVVVQQIEPDVWTHTTYFDLPEYGRVPANGLILIGENEALLVDTPWTEPQTALLLDWIWEREHVAVKTVIPTHSHQDCAGGLAEAHRRKAQSWALDKTADLLKREGKPLPTHVFSEKTSLTCGQTPVELFYPGPGHAVDNIVVWFPEERILFAGCLVKSLDAQNLGNTKDGDLKRYPETLKNVKQAYPDAEWIIPGHGAAGGLDLLDHTLKLCENNSGQQPATPEVPDLPPDPQKEPAP
jgi:metallo-beta-lactamase class B